MNPTIQKTLVFSSLVKDTVNRCKDYRLDASGKGVNVSRVLSQLGKDVCHLTQLGGILRPLFLDLCSNDNLRVEWVESLSPIRFAYTLIERTEKNVTEIVEEAEKVDEGTEKRLFDEFARLAPGFSTLVISGTMAAGFSDKLIPDMVCFAREQGLRVILDVRGNDLVNSLACGPDIVKPNLCEFISTFAPDLTSHNNTNSSDIHPNNSDIKKRVGNIWSELYKKYPCSLILTRGPDPVWYAEKGDLAEYAFESVEPFNTTGSGDAFTAGLAAAMDDGASLADAIGQAVRCGVLNAGLLRPSVIK